MKAASTMARVFHADQVADSLSDFETEVESEGSMYNESVMIATLERMMEAWMTVMLQPVTVML